MKHIHLLYIQASYINIYKSNDKIIIGMSDKKQLVSLFSGNHWFIQNNLF